MPKKTARFNRTFPRPEKISSMLYRIRREMGVGRPEMGSWVGKSDSTVKRWEAGHRISHDDWFTILRYYTDFLIERRNRYDA